MTALPTDADNVPSDIPSDKPTTTGHKLRQCLRCRATFHSEWAGERICSRCKSTSAWRNGTVARVRPMSNGR